MARPRIFISSTFYDLKHVRYDLEKFIETIGYEPIMNDRGHIPYSGDRPLEVNCYDEVGRCDVLVGIIGNKYGTSSQQDDEYSISMNEIKTAIRNNKQVFIFVEKAVLNENRLFSANKDINIKYVAVDDIKIHKFIEEIQLLSMNNALIPFESASDIIDYLKEQFAGLFQRLLLEKATITEQTTYYDLKETIDELKIIVKEISNESEEFWDKFESSIFATKLVLRVLRNRLSMKKAFFFANSKEAMFELLNSMCFIEQYKEPGDNNFVFTKKENGTVFKLSISEEVFDENEKIKDFRDIRKVEELILIEYITDDDDDIPF